MGFLNKYFPKYLATAKVNQLVGDKIFSILDYLIISFSNGTKSFT